MQYSVITRALLQLQPHLHLPRPPSWVSFLLHPSFSFFFWLAMEKNTSTCQRRCIVASLVKRQQQWSLVCKHIDLEKINHKSHLITSFVCVGLALLATLMLSFHIGSFKNKAICSLPMYLDCILLALSWSHNSEPWMQKFTLYPTGINSPVNCPA